MSGNMRITQAEFARRIGVARSTITKAVRSGRIALGSDCKIDWETQSIAWEQNRRIEKDHGSRGVGAGKSRVEDSTYQKLLAANKQMDYKLKELKLKEMEGEVISKENLQKHLGPKLTLIKSHMMTLPARHAHTLAALLNRNDEKLSKSKSFHKILAKRDEQQLARDIGEILDSDMRVFFKEIASAERF